MDSARRRLAELNSEIKAQDELYHNAATALGLSDCAFWILYSLQCAQADVTQSELCAELYQPKQTVNSAIKKLESDGNLALTTGADRRSRLLHLTEKGAAFAAQTVDKVLSAEQEALGGMTGAEQERMLALLHKYTGLLKQAMHKHIS